MSDETRLARIETKIDQLSDAVVSLARMEERMITLFKRMDSYDDRQSKLEEKVDGLDNEMTKRGVVFRIVDRSMWLVAGAVIVAWAKELFS
jgi:phage shock protein A